MVADLALQILGSIRVEVGDGGGFEVLEARVKALKGLIQLICGNFESGKHYMKLSLSYVFSLCSLLSSVFEIQPISAANSFFEGVQEERFFIGKVLLNERHHA